MPSHKGSEITVKDNSNPRKRRDSCLPPSCPVSLLLVGFRVCDLLVCYAAHLVRVAGASSTGRHQQYRHPFYCMRGERISSLRSYVAAVAAAAAPPGTLLLSPLGMSPPAAAASSSSNRP